MPLNPLRWFPEFLALGTHRLRPQARLMGWALIVGVCAGLGAVVFHLACQVIVALALDGSMGYHPAHPTGEPPLFGESSQPFQPWLLLIIPTLGGLVSGYIVFRFAPEAEGHGTDAAIDSYHNKQGYIRPRVPVVKIVASAVTIGTGGSGGREGPIAQTGAGIGSVIGTLLRMRPADRRILMAAGMAAGIAAIFRAPLAGAMFAAEVLYRSPDFESEVIIPAGLASVTAYCTYGAVFGMQPLFMIPPEILKLLTFTNPIELVAYTILVVFVVLLAMMYTRTFYGMRYLFHRLPMPTILKPALGAGLTGALGLVLYLLFQNDLRALSVMSSGYGLLQGALTMRGGQEGDLGLALLLFAVAVGKIYTTGLTIGSGGSGGVFGPAVVIGGCGSGALGILLHWLQPNFVPHPANFVIVGMAGFFAAAAKTPFSTLVMVSELTGNYGLLLPTLWVCTLSFLLADEFSLYSSQVESRSRSPAHQGDYVREVLAGQTVRQLLKTSLDLPLVSPAHPLSELLAQLTRTPYQILLVADADRRLLGIVSLEEVHMASQSPHLRNLILAEDLMRSNVTPLTPGDRLDRALETFVESDLFALPVIDDAKTRKIIGMLKRADVSMTYLRQVHGVPDKAAVSYDGED